MFLTAVALLMLLISWMKHELWNGNDASALVLVLRTLADKVWVGDVTQSKT